MNLMIRDNFYPKLKNIYSDSSKTAFCLLKDQAANGYKNYSNRETLIYSSGLINLIWNRWNSFWRNYWIANVIGGIGLDKKKLLPLKLYADYSNLQVLCLMKDISNSTGSIKHKYGNSLKGGHEEITWGDAKKITNICSNLIKHSSDFGLSTMQIDKLDLIISLLSTYKIYLDHCQQIRNTYMHLNEINIRDVLIPISSHYAFSGLKNNIINILGATHISDKTPCLVNISQHMTAMIQAME